MAMCNCNASNVPEHYTGSIGCRYISDFLSNGEIELTYDPITRTGDINPSRGFTHDGSGFSGYDSKGNPKFENAPKAEKGKRPEDQPLPVPNGHLYAHDVAARLVLDRGELGRKRYGTRLQPHSGRDYLQDAIEEAADLLCYLVGLKMERDTPEKNDNAN